jgi:hypothetical protein
VNNKQAICADSQVAHEFADPATTLCYVSCWLVIVISVSGVAAATCALADSLGTATLLLSNPACLPATVCVPALNTAMQRNLIP